MTVSEPTSPQAPELPDVDAEEWRRVESLIGRSCTLLDAEDFEGYLSLFTEDSKYEVWSIPPEIRRRQTPMYLSYAELENLLSQIRHHLPQANIRTRIAGHSEIVGGDADRLRLRTNVSIFVTDHMTGQTSVWAVVRYHDEIRRGDSPRIADRSVELITRDLWQGSLLPI